MFMKKGLIFSAVLALGFSLTPHSYADSNKGIKDLHINLESYDQSIVKDILEDPSMSLEDAIYYAKLDKLIKEMDKQGIEYELPKSKASNSTFSDDYVRLNKKDFQQKVLELDPNALQKALSSEIRLRSQGVSDLQNIVSTFKENTGPVQTFSMEYPDGSRITSTVENIIETDSSKIVSVFSPEEIEQINSGTVSNTETPEFTTLAITPYIIGPWDTTSHINTESSYLYNSTTGWPSGQTRQITSKTEWSFSSGVNYSKLNDIFQWQWYGVVNGSGESSVYNFSVAPVSDGGAGKSYGVVKVKNEFPSHPRKSGTGTNGKAQGYMDVQFEVTSTFSAAWGALGIYVDAGGQWHQYAITEVDGWSNIDHYAGTFK